MPRHSAISPSVLPIYCASMTLGFSLVLRYTKLPTGGTFCFCDIYFKKYFRYGIKMVYLPVVVAHAFNHTLGMQRQTDSC